MKKKSKLIKYIYLLILPMPIIFYFLTNFTYFKKIADIRLQCVSDDYIASICNEIFIEKSPDLQLGIMYLLPIYVLLLIIHIIYVFKQLKKHK